MSRGDRVTEPCERLDEKPRRSEHLGSQEGNPMTIAGARIFGRARFRNGRARLERAHARFALSRSCRAPRFVPGSPSLADELQQAVGNELREQMLRLVLASTQVSRRTFTTPRPLAVFGRG
jgi:hypothetical protein